MLEFPDRISVMACEKVFAGEPELFERLERKNLTLLKASGAEGVRRFALEECIDIALLDIETSSKDDHAVLRILQDYCPVTQVIVLAPEISVEGAVALMRQGASDVVRPPFDAERILALIREAWTRKKILRENRLLQQEIQRRTEEPLIVGSSPAIRRVLEMARKIAPADVSVLIQGETGVGKNLVARLIHQESGREEKPFVTVDCTTIPDTLFESELFGHHKGSFSGADRLKYGLVEVANGGTLFLDEIGEVPLALQSKLLRVTETGCFRRLGGLRDQEVDLRVVAATNRSLLDMCAKGGFRKDLLYRLQVVTIEVPPLRERPEDIAPLATHFLQSFAPSGGQPLVLAPETLDRMVRYRWPGNIRELRNVLERAQILAEGRVVRPQDLHSLLGRPCEDDSAGGEGAMDCAFSIKAHERRLIRDALAFAQGNRRRASRLLGISERSLFRRLKEWQFQE